MDPEGYESAALSRIYRNAELLRGVFNRVVLFVSLLSIFHAAAEEIRIFHILVLIYRCIFYSLYSFVLPARTPDVLKDFITVAVFSVLLSVQYAREAYAQFALDRARAANEKAKADALAREQRASADSADGVAAGVIIGGLLFGPIGAVIGGILGNLADGDARQAADAAELQAAALAEKQKLQYDLAFRALVQSVGMVLTANIFLLLAFFLVDTHSNEIHAWLLRYDRWLHETSEHALHYLERHVTPCLTSRASACAGQVLSF